MISKRPIKSYLYWFRRNVCRRYCLSSRDPAFGSVTALCLDLKLARTLKVLLCGGRGRGSGGADIGTSAELADSKVGLIKLDGGGALVNAGSVTDDATENCRNEHHSLIPSELF